MPRFEINICVAVVRPKEEVIIFIIRLDSSEGGSNYSVLRGLWAFKGPWWSSLSTQRRDGTAFITPADCKSAS